MKRQEVQALMDQEFNGYECEVSVEQRDGHFRIEVKPRAFSAYSKVFDYSPGGTRAEVSAHRFDMIREVFRGVASERAEAELRSELNEVKRRSAEHEALRHSWAERSLELTHELEAAKKRIAELETINTQPGKTKAR